MESIHIATPKYPCDNLPLHYVVMMTCLYYHGDILIGLDNISIINPVHILGNFM